MKRLGKWRLAVLAFTVAVLAATATSAQTPLTVLHSFTASPNSLIQHPDGNFYGTSGSGDGSVFFRMTPDGTVTPLHTFSAAEGGGNLTLGANGDFYGTTPSQFDSLSQIWRGRAFSLTPSGSLTLLPWFFYNSAHLGVQASDGYLYGGAENIICSGPGPGTHCDFSEYAFKMTPAGSTKVVHSFSSQGSTPLRESIDAEGNDGNLYGTQYFPGSFGPTSLLFNGIFRMTQAGVTTFMHGFTGADDGQYGFVQFQSADGNLYGTTATGGTSRIGAIFRLAPDGTFTIVHSFAGGAADGAAPVKLIEGTDGNFYGITTQGGTASLGTVYRLTPDGEITLLHSFDATEGSPQSLLQGVDGKFYGTTATLAWSLPGPPVTGVPPDAPTGLTAAAPASGVPRVSLSWTAAAGAASYTVKRGTASGMETTVAVGLKFPRWTDAVNASGTRYYYVVSAVNAGGESANSNEVSARVTARASDYDGDGTADLLVYRPSGGEWFDRNTGLVYLVGESGDVPLPGDYDGDGLNDFALYRPSAGNWIILPSRTNTLEGERFGSAADLPVPGDYDGDGTFDLALYRPSTGIWFIRQSSTGTIVTRALGVGADIPVPADYDGDGVIDIAVYRPASGMWHIRKSSTGGTTSLAFQWGLAGDVPVPGDYDGDGLADVAVFRPGSGAWLVRLSATATLATRAFGTAADLTVPGDYDADGKTDLAVYRPSTGVWYVADLATGVALPGYPTQWGLAGDIPAVNVTIRNAMTVIGATPPVSTVATLVRGGDFDADGRGDLSVYRPSTGAWFTLLSQTGFTGYTATAFGTAGDAPVPGDYDGDGKSDLAVFAASTGEWSIALSGGGAAARQWGLDGDVPVPADYDGDGITDLAVFRPANGVWYILQSSSNSTVWSEVQWGLNGDVPVPGDYDGDGITDNAVFRPANGTWYILKSSTGYSAFDAIQWGLPGDIVVPGDYDGDARTDIAVYRPVNGTWYILRSSSGFTTSDTYQWGLSGDIPVPSDYDGDGRTDAAVYRPDNGVWYLLNSGTGFTSSSTIQWGLPGDIPIFRRQ
jgi:uncharacterized repeat protein (TIGR03803 family)